MKGPGKSVSVVVWLIRESGNHAIAGIWHEGTDLASATGPVRKIERGKRQYALFAGLAANAGAAAVHVSENGGSSFGDKYARNLAVTPEVIPAVPTNAPAEVLDKAWSVAAFSFDNARNTVTAWLDGKASEFWIDQPQKHPFFQWPYKGWIQAQLHRTPGLQDGEDATFPADQFFEPPELRPLARTVLSQRDTERVELHTFAFTKVRVTLRKEGKSETVVKRELIAIRANPFWFPHDLYSPASLSDGGPFTIGRVIHTSRNVGFTGYLGGVAVFDRLLSAGDMKRLAAIARDGPVSADKPGH